MSIFVVFRVGEPDKLKAAIEDNYPDNFLEVAVGQWLVSAKGTAKEISDKLGITNDERKPGITPAMVVKSDGYYGRAAGNIWEWMKVKIETADG